MSGQHPCKVFHRFEPAENCGMAPLFKKLFIKEGVDLIYANFKSFLTQNGVKEIETENADFNTDIHEAVTTIPAPAPELKGKVLDCIEKGYYLNDKVMRFAKVVVGE